MSSMINNLGTKLFKQGFDKAGDLGEKFEEEFSQLSANITEELDLVVTEVISLSGYIKVTLVILCVLLVIAIIRYSAFGWRAVFYKAREWLRANDNKPAPQVILLMPTDDGKYRKASTVYSDQQTKHILDRMQQDSFELFNESLNPGKPQRAPRLSTKQDKKGLTELA